MKLESVDAVVEELVGDVANKKSERRNWKWIDTLEKAQQVYKEEFLGLKRNAVLRLAGGFYYHMRKMGWLDEVFPPNEQSHFRDLSCLDTPEKAKDYYEKNCCDMSRTQVSKAEPGFYEVLRKNDWLDIVLPERKTRDWSCIDTPEKALQYYEDRCAGKSRSAVRKVDTSFHSFVSRKGWLDAVFPKSNIDNHRDWSECTIEDAKIYFAENCEAKNRNELNNEDSVFYKMLRRRGWLDEIIPSTR